MLALYGCDPEPVPLTVAYIHATSPDGLVEASAFERSGDAGVITEVPLSFPNDCESGAVSAYQLGLRLELRWVDNSNLEVIHPPGVKFQRNSSGEVIQCSGRQVRIYLLEKAQ